MPSVGSFSLDRTRMPLEISIAEWGDPTWLRLFGTEITAIWSHWLHSPYWQQRCESRQAPFIGADAH